ncbi:MAG: DNA polymerase III subunit gamma/tau [Clostridia bacterium]|nr:DNA polymerase III subunit gamma/tau [Clostridia bacterium]
MYRALYRKWRPAVFSDVAGQPHVTETLMHEVETGKLSHAYLFTGSRGTGKTTCAKILAKAVNCLHPVGGNPCGECEICRGIDDGSVLDVIEIDAASNNGVDNIRDLREEANFTPARAKYRVYIIDEVHMLSIGAFNALLKILEEPPSYVLFILATTEVHKLPPTILSRCQRFDFHHIPPESIAARLQYVAEQEKIDLTDEGAVMIARYADGALRDALSLLDRCSARGETITEEVVGACAGIAGKEYLFRMADCIASQNAADALRLIGELHASSCNMERLCVELTEHFRNLMVTKVVRDPQNLIICSKEDLRSYHDQSECFTLESILHVLSVLGDMTANLKRGLDRKIETEMAVLRLCTPSLSTDPDAMLRRIAELERRIETGIVPAAVPEIKESVPVFVEQTPAPEKEAVAAPAAAKSEPTPQKPPEPDVKAPAAAKSENALYKLWPEVLLILKETSKPLSGILVGSTATVSGKVLQINSANAALPQMLEIPLYKDAIRKAVKKISGLEMQISVRDAKQEAKKTDPLQDLISKINNLKESEG